MVNTRLLKQTKDKPLFPDLLWSRPENKNLAGKLLIIGGNLHGFSSVAAAYLEALSAGAGQVRALMPDAIKKTVGKVLGEADFAASTRSGSFARAALGELLDVATWADCVLLGGDVGKNSETTLLLDSFLIKYKGVVCAAKDVIDLFSSQTLLLERSSTVLILTMAQAQKLGISSESETAFTSNMGLLSLAEGLAALTKKYPAGIIIRHLDSVVVAYKGNVSSTLTDQAGKQWEIGVAARASVMLMQNPSKVFEALTASLIL